MGEQWPDLWHHLSLFMVEVTLPDRRLRADVGHLAVFFRSAPVLAPWDSHCATFFFYPGFIVEGRPSPADAG